MWWNRIYFAPENEQGAEGEAPGVSPEQMREILNFDPFTPPAADAPDGGEGEGPKAASGGEPPPKTEELPAAKAVEGLAASTTSTAASPSQPSEPAKKEGEGDPLADVRKQISDFLNKKPEAEAQPQPVTPKAAEPAKAGEAAAEGPKYNFSVPDTVVEAIRSDDPAVAKQGLSAVVNSVMNQLVKDFSGALVELRKELMEHAPRAAMERVSAEQTVQRIKDDFYGAWPGLKQAAESVPGVDGAIWSTIVQAGKNAGVNSWTPEFRDNVGAMIHLSLGIPLPQGKAATTTTTTATPKPKAVFSAGGGNGGRANGAASDEFMEVLSAGQ